MDPMRRPFVPFAAGAALLVAALAQPGCGTSDMGHPDAVEDWVEEDQPAGSIVFDADNVTDIGYRERAEITGVHLGADGRPASATVTLSLLGSAYDTSLQDTVVQTDEDGAFAATIIAGSVSTQFSLRAVSPDGARAELPMSIVPPDQATLEIDPFVEGRRRVDRYAVQLFADAPCPVQGVEPVLQWPSLELPIVLTGLAERSSFTVAVDGMICDEDVPGDDCIVWVKGCREGVETDGAAPSAVTVTLLDDVLFFSHEAFATRTTLDASALLEEHIATLVAPLQPLATSAGGVATLLLDGIQTGFDPADADVFLGARQASGMDGQVESLILDAGGWDPETEIEGLEAFLASSAAGIDVRGRLEKDLWPASPDDSIMATHILESVKVSGGVDLLGALLATEAMESQTAVTYERDVASLGPHGFPIGGGSFLVAAAGLGYIPMLMTGEVPPGDPLSAWLDSHVDCQAVGELLASNDVMAGLVGAENADVLYELHCMEFLEGIVQNVHLAAEGIDLEIPQISLGGTADFLETDGSPRPGRAAVGLWTEALWGEAVFPDPPAFTLDQVDSLF